MASYFVACHALADGAHTVHDRSRCPPACFPHEHATEYLGEFSDPTQAMAVARLRFAAVRRCGCCEPQGLMRAAVPEPQVLQSLRS